MFHEWPAATADKKVLPGVLGCSFDFAQDRLPLRHTVQVRLGFDFGFWISDLGFLTVIYDTELNGSDFTIRSLALTRFSVNFQSEFRIPNSAIVDPVALSSPRSRDGNSCNIRARFPVLVLSPLSSPSTDAA
jgi:hypothetical protein